MVTSPAPASGPIPVAEAVVIRPGDVLVIRCDPGVSTADADAVRAKVLARLPGLADVLIIGSAQQLAVYRPAGDDAEG